MKNRIPGNPGKYSAIVPLDEVEKIQSGEPFSITIRRNDNPIEEGTPFSKETILPDTVAEQICPNNPDPTPADAFASMAKVKKDVGNKEEAFGHLLYEEIEGAYINKDGDVIKKDGCYSYGANNEDSPKILGKTVKIRTYMYGDMAISAGDPIQGNIVVNENANIEKDPESGIFETTIFVPVESEIEDFYTISVAFCENPYIDKPVMFEPRGTVWQEIKLLENSSGSGGVDNRELYRHIDNKDNPHKVTAKQIGAVTHLELKNALDSLEIPEGGSITEEQFIELFNKTYDAGNYDYLMDTAYIENYLNDHMEFITEQVIAALPVYGGELA